MHRDLNAAINILRRATAGHAGSQASGEETSTHYKHNGASIFCEGGSPGL
jgi:transposase